jgi:hypothetical protein
MLSYSVAKTVRGRAINAFCKEYQPALASGPYGGRKTLVFGESVIRRPLR